MSIGLIVETQNPLAKFQSNALWVLALFEALHHPEEGSHYTSKQFKRLLADNGVTGAQDLSQLQ